MSFGLRLFAFGDSGFYKLPRKAHELSLEGKPGSEFRNGVLLRFLRDSND